MSGELILLVDDEPSIIQLASLYLEREGFQVCPIKDGRSALEFVRKTPPALMVLDIMLPELDGFEVCKHLRAENNSVPILILTARDEDIDKILGLEMGADDYLTKPFNPRELVARIKAILRRNKMVSEKIIKDAIRIGDLMIDLGSREVTCRDKKIDLRTQEFEVLTILAQHKNIVLTRDQLLNLAWGFDFLGQTRTVDVHIAQLRRKLSDSHVEIETVTGVGYKLVE
jgi:two-component system, OmpR family, alkaline phosphatase synthesis response regulator PhoP